MMIKNSIDTLLIIKPSVLWGYGYEINYPADKRRNGMTYIGMLCFFND
jgi:hypothetical protein